MIHIRDGDALRLNVDPGTLPRMIGVVATGRLHTAVDPGTRTSGVVQFKSDEWPPRIVFHRSEFPNRELADALEDVLHGTLSIEMIASYGKPVGQEVFETVWWTGQFCHAFQGDFQRVFRAEAKKHICHSVHSKDPHVRQAIMDMYPPTGGGKRPVIGTKKQPGPLYGVTEHSWAALAVGITACGAESLKLGVNK